MCYHPDEIIALGESQVMRFIDEINGVKSAQNQIREIKHLIKLEKRKEKSRQAKACIQELYKQLYSLQFQKDYVCVVMKSEKDYDRANKGFLINGIKYRRLLGTNGGVKNSTIVYINEELYPEIKHRIDNGRDMSKELIPGKLESYQALVCSGSIPLPSPRGIIVVNDCITHFKDDVIVINDSGEGEPDLQYVDGFDIEHNNSDGCGMMTPAYSRIVNEYLNDEPEKAMSGMNTRYAWEKGMVYTFDFVKFARDVAGTYTIIDAWGDKRDVRDADVILTTSMLKLWDSYSSWEDYYNNCEKNHYQFSAAKTTPDELEHVRNMNYQFLQSYDFTDQEIKDLCRQTINEIKDVLGMDYRKSLVFLAGFGLNEKNIRNVKEPYVKALMAEPDLINDPFIRKKIYLMIRKRIDIAKKGSIQVAGNFAMIGGDLYALCESMFGLPVVGLLKPGEIFHKYWYDKGAEEVSCFRAPMTCHNNIRKLRVSKDDRAHYWFRYINTAIILNAWDTTCDAMNGCDFDGDTFMCTNNEIILKNTKNSRTIICVQRKAKKKIVTEEDIIESNKIAFNDDIGKITNYITSMFEVQAGFDKESKEYKTLDYRIMCGQAYQQASIDRIKGIVANPMPRYWHSKDGKDEFNDTIAAYRKPYFMIYVYPSLRADYKEFEKNIKKYNNRLYGRNHTHIYDEYDDINVVGKNNCTVNKIAFLIEKEFDGIRFDISNCSNIIDLGCDYNNTGTKSKKIQKIYNEYIVKFDNFKQNARKQGVGKDDVLLKKELFLRRFKEECLEITTNEFELLCILFDFCYKKDKLKQFFWDICGDSLVDFLVEKNNGAINYPVISSDECDFEYGGEKFRMEQSVL